MVPGQVRLRSAQAKGEGRKLHQDEREAPGTGGLRVSSVQSGAMRVHDTVLHMRTRLLERGVDLIPERAEASAQYEGPGQNATQAWEAFRAVAVEPAFDPIQKWGEDHAVRSAGFLFEALYSEGWPSRHGHRGMPEHYELSFQRRFAVGDYGDMLGLDLSVFVAAADELRALRATLNGDDRGDPELFAPVAHDWIAQVEASPAFVTPMRRHPALRFSFGVDGIG